MWGKRRTTSGVVVEGVVLDVVVGVVTVVVVEVAVDIGGADDEVVDRISGESSRRC